MRSLHTSMVIKRCQMPENDFTVRAGVAKCTKVKPHTFQSMKNILQMSKITSSNKKSNQLIPVKNKFFRTVI